MKSDWNKDSYDEARLAVSDGIVTSYVSENQLPEEFTLRQVAEKYAQGYDHNGNDDEYSVCVIEDLSDGEMARFAFDGRGDFEWRTDRQHLIY